MQHNKSDNIFFIQRNRVWSQSFQKGSKGRSQICIRNLWFLSQGKYNIMVADSKSKSDLSFGKTFASSAFSACFAEVINNTLSGFFSFFHFFFWGFFVSADFLFHDLMKDTTFMLMACSSSSHGSDLQPHFGRFLITVFFFFCCVTTIVGDTL